jgi:hypothetical protein
LSGVGEGGADPEAINELQGIIETLTNELEKKQI